METMQMPRSRRFDLALALVASALLGACASPSRTPAPVEDRTGMRVAPAPAVATPEPPKLPGAENAGKPGYYTVKPGDTIIRIGLENGQNWRDIARWNNLDNPNLIETGQVLRVQPPVAAAVATADGVVTRPVAPASASTAPLPPASAAASSPRGTVTAAAPTLPVNTPPVAPGDDEVNFAWPTGSGAAVLAGFDEQKNKGVDIGGKVGDPVLAAADGRVVYAGAGLRGYGNLIILKHNNTYLTAYAHNQSLLVKEDQAVRKGQKIAEMGSSDTDRVKLHFEIRRQGKPVDPTRYLPPR
ncbi:peptidoglycan DD-metalloendopeptidase family protein [Caenimonas sedimenti]|uniref:Peptidoglycan DD-metalloendopeptidase family protein n=2 Tax=Caenimonas sedimenti TaxID=2596921 RepID=A0A562ZWJ2_9BURK|nr:peptidoglycan DD-metalloendopeptidase family protein [Caenimonas sedimenti]